MDSTVDGNNAVSLSKVCYELENEELDSILMNWVLGSKLYFSAFKDAGDLIGVQRSNSSLRTSLSLRIYERGRTRAHSHSRIT